MASLSESASAAGGPPLSSEKLRQIMKTQAATIRMPGIVGGRMMGFGGPDMTPSAPSEPTILESGSQSLGGAATTVAPMGGALAAAEERRRKARRAT